MQNIEWWYFEKTALPLAFKTWWYLFVTASWYTTIEYRFTYISVFLSRFHSLKHCPRRHSQPTHWVCWSNHLSTWYRSGFNSIKSERPTSERKGYFMKQYKIFGTKFFLSRLTQFRKFLLIFLRLDKGKLWGGNLNYQTSQIVRVFRLFEHFVCIDIENYIEQRAVHLYWPWVEKENIVELCLISPESFSHQLVFSASAQTLPDT